MSDGSTPASGGPRDPFVGTTLVGKYRIDGLLGAGAMGKVYRATHLELDAAVAIKLLRPERAAHPEALARFRQEARATSRLRHPNIITVFDFGQTETGQPYLVTEMLSGRTLLAILREDWPLAPQRIVRLLSQALAGLDAAHQQGVIHRDFKLENILVTRFQGEEQVKVLDFGLAEVGGQPIPEWRPGNVSGTPDYMPPEQIRCEPMDARSDLYAAGVVLYELLTGTAPFRGNLVEVLTGHLHHPVEPPQLRRLDTHIPTALEEVCLRALGKAREERFASAAEMKAALEAAVDDLRVSCSGCGAHVLAAARQCTDCGAAMAQRIVRPGVELPPRFVGREEELGRLLGAATGAVRIVGPGGSGRTRLVEEWRRLAEEQGQWVIVLRPDASGSARPWWPVRAALRSVLGLSEQPTKEEVWTACWTRPSNAPGLLEVLGVGGALPRDEQDLRRREAIAAAAATLRNASTALLCEDVDRYDESSLEVVRQLLAQPGPSRVIVTTAPEVDLAGGEELRLGPLGPGALAVLGFKPQGLPDPGWPLDVEQALRARAEGAPDSSPLGRMSLVPPLARRVLALLAVAGGESEVELLDKLVGQDTRGSLGLLAARGLVRVASGQGHGRVLCPSPTLRARLYQALDPAERRKHHHALAALLARHSDDAVLLAHHHWQADPDSAPLDLLEQAAAAAAQALDFTGAIAWYRRALQRCPAGNRRGRIVLSLAQSLAHHGESDAAEQAFAEALSLAPDELAVIAAARSGMGQLALARGDTERALEELGRALMAAIAAYQPGAVAHLCTLVARLQARTGQFREASRTLRRGLPMARWTPELAAQLLVAAAEVACSAQTHHEAIDLAESALSTGQLSARDRARAHLVLARVHALAGRNRSLADAHRRAALEELTTLGDRRALAELLLSFVETEERGSSHARTWLRQAAELATAIGWREGLERVAELRRALEDAG